MKVPKTIVASAVILCLVGGVYGVRTARGRDAVEPAAAMLAAPKAAGNAAARIRVLEFIDYQCPSCAKSSYFLHELVKLHPQEFFLEVKYFPLKGHKHSLTSAKFVECGRMQGKFWETHNAVFLSQPAWRDLEDAQPVLRQAAAAAGMDMTAADRCLADPAVDERILAERDEAVRLGLRSTPTFYINGTMVVGFNAMSAEMTKLFPDAAEIRLPADNQPVHVPAPAQVSAAVTPESSALSKQPVQSASAS